MTKDEAVDYMISKVEKIEKDRINATLSTDATSNKREVVESIMKALKEVTIDK